MKAHSRSRLHGAGFTFIELIMVMVIIGIMAVVVMPRMFDRAFEEAGMHDTAKAALQHARRSAVAARRYVCVNVVSGTGTGATVSLTMDTRMPESFSTAISCSAPLNLPSPTRGCASNQVCGSTGVGIVAGSTASMIFDPLGRLVNASRNVATNASISTTNKPTPITVYAETGFIE